MTFWYYINGPSNEILSVFIFDIQTNKTTRMWDLGARNLGREWHYGSFGFYYEKPYTIFLRALSTENDSTIAVDDIIFKESQYCSTTPLSAESTVLPIPTTTKPTTTTRDPSASTVKPSAFDCDFEKDLCSYENDLSRPMQWSRNKGSTTTSDTGPNVDHT